MTTEHSFLLASLERMNAEHHLEMIEDGQVECRLDLSGPLKFLMLSLC